MSSCRATNAKPKNVFDWIEYNAEHAKRQGLGLLWDRPHNRDALVGRVRSWEELYDRVYRRYCA